MLIGGANNNPNCIMLRNNCRYGVLAINAANIDYTNLGQFYQNEFHRYDSMKQGSASVGYCIEIPVQRSGNPSTPTVSIKAYVPTSGIDGNTDETGAFITAFNPAANATVSWP
jgi:hypothetical protein